jgi:hypothetical protein
LRSSDTASSWRPGRAALRACSASGCRRAWRHRGHRVQRRREHRGRPGTDKLAGAARFNRREAAATGRSSRHGWWRSGAENRARRRKHVPEHADGSGGIERSPKHLHGVVPRRFCPVGLLRRRHPRRRRRRSSDSGWRSASRERLVREQRWCGSRWRANFKDGRRVQ